MLDSADGKTGTTCVTPSLKMNRNSVFIALLSIGTLAGAISCSKTSVNKPAFKETTMAQPIPKTAVNIGSHTSAPDFEADCVAGLTKAKAMLPTLLAADTTFDKAGFLMPYNEMIRNMEHSDATAGLLHNVHPSKEIRDQAAKCAQEVSAFGTELSLNQDLYKAFSKIDVSNLGDEEKRLVEHSLRDYKRAGVDKDDVTRARLKAIQEELTKLGQQFSKNLVEDVKHIEVDSAADLEGLPADYIKAHAPGKNGKIKITTEYPDYVPFMQYAKNNEWRKKIYIQSKTRGGQANEDILRQTLKLRAEKAKLLGYKNWADYVTEDKMMKSGDAAQKFIEKVVGVSKQRAQKDYEELLAWKKANMDPKARKVFDWEKSYIENNVKKENYQFDSQSVRPYFEYNRVQAGLLDITSKIYGIEYRPIADAKLWHGDVDAFEVYRNNDMVGRIYLDMHPREGKYGHAAQFTYRSGVQGVQHPEGVLVCNFPDPKQSEGPALMQHGDVVTMFHEFGHLMHHVLGGQRNWIEQSGVATEWDFVEAPSQMFEEWAWTHETLALFAEHVDTKETISKDIVDRMTRADKFGVGAQTVQQMFYASISLGFHRADPEKLDMLGMVKDLQAKYTPFDYVEGTKFHASFGHLQGYSAMYYTYMFSLVIAKDLLTPFKNGSLMNTELTHQYRDKILSQGGVKDAAELVKDFLGRDYSFEAFEAYLNEG